MSSEFEQNPSQAPLPQEVDEAQNKTQTSLQAEESVPGESSAQTPRKPEEQVSVEAENQTPAPTEEQGSGQAEGQEGAHHGATPGDDSSPDWAVYHAVCDGEKLRR